MTEYLFRASKGGKEYIEHWVTEAESVKLRQIYSDLGWCVHVRDPSQVAAYAQLAMLRSLKYDRKPDTWSHVQATVGRSQLPILPVYQADEIGADRGPCAYFRRTVDETVFLVAHRQEMFLVNTEGANYCRYVAHVEMDA